MAGGYGQQRVTQDVKPSKKAVKKRQELKLLQEQLDAVAQSISELEGKQQELQDIETKITQAQAKAIQVDLHVSELSSSKAQTELELSNVAAELSAKSTELSSVESKLQKTIEVKSITFKFI